MNYFDELKRAMEFMAQDPRTIFLGQCVGYPGNALYKTVCDIDARQRIELPVMEETQMGMSIGMSLNGLIPVSVYPRWNFLVLATNQLANHLDKFPGMSGGRVQPKVIIRVCVGSTDPLHPGVQHCSDFTEAYKTMLETVNVVRLEEPFQVFAEYKLAFERKDNVSTILVEVADFYKKEN
jgi:pyruvate/2-oxoglutarate/acetoin dehydrogenase E1 component